MVWFVYTKLGGMSWILTLEDERSAWSVVFRIQVACSLNEAEHLGEFDQEGKYNVPVAALLEEIVTDREHPDPPRISLLALIPNLSSYRPRSGAAEESLIHSVLAHVMEQQM